MRLDSMSPFKRRKHANIKRLQYMRAVRRYNKKINIVLYVVGDKITLDITSMPIRDE
jgi:hypothetical protein